MGDKVLLVNSCEEMRIRSDSINTDIITAVSRLVQRHCCWLSETGITVLHVQGVDSATVVEMIVKSHAVSVGQREVWHFIFAGEISECQNVGSPCGNNFYS